MFVAKSFRMFFKENLLTFFMLISFRLSFNLFLWKGEMFLKSSREPGFPFVVCTHCCKG